ncbi:MAG: hypothetical protein IKV44_03080 [Clostridia bacterium]|nr:hypothetical protein [Clostridia bacterium]
MLMLISVFSVSAFAATTPAITSAYAGYFGATLTWTKDVGAAGYGVYRFDSAESSPVLIADVATTSYIDKTVTYGSSYKYAIASKNVDGSFEPVSINDAVLVTYERVQVRSVYSNYDGINFTWKSNSTAKNGYRIYRSVNEGKFAFLTDVKTTSYVDADVKYGTFYQYHIVSLGADGNYTESLQTAVPLKVNYNLVDLKVPTATNNGVELIWTKLDGAEGYEIYRISDQEGDEGVLVGTTAADVCKFTDAAVEEGVTYSYCVIVMGSGATPDYANGRSIKYTLAKFYKHVNQFDGLKLEWTPVQNAAKYYLYKNGSLLEVLDTTSYLDKDVVNGNSYKYSLDVQFKNGVIATFSYESLVNPDLYVEAREYANGFLYQRPVCSRIGVNDAGITVHTFYTDVDKAVIDLEPTVYNVGYKHYVCSECGVKSSQQIIAQRAPKTPEILSLHNTNLGVKLTWEIVDGADVYVVYRRATINGVASGWQIIKMVTGDNCYDNTVQTGAYYKYAVKAVRRTTYASSIAVVKDKEQGINSLFWAKNFARANSYFIYRKDTKTSAYWNTIGLISDKNSFYSESSGKYLAFFKDVNPTTDENVYCVRAALSSDLGSGRVIRAVKTPTGFTVKNNVSGILFTWNKVAGATSYRVYRKLESDRYWTFMGYTTKTYYPDYQTASGNTYVYTVRAVCNGHFSDYVRDGIKITRLDAPKLVSAKSSVEGITVEFEQVSGGVRYNVYRKTANSSWVMIGKVTNLNSSAYLDRSAVKGVTYTYTVRAVDSLTAGADTDMSGFYSGISCKDLY